MRYRSTLEMGSLVRWMAGARVLRSAVVADATTTEDRNRRVNRLHKLKNALEHDAATIVGVAAAWRMDASGITAFFLSPSEVTLARCLQQLGLIRKHADLLARSDRPDPRKDDRLFWHSDDFSTILWNGVEYNFGGDKQRHVLRMLWEQSEKHAAALAEKTIQTRLSNMPGTTEAFTTRIDHLFRNHIAWGKVLGPGKAKGTIELNWP